MANPRILAFFVTLSLSFALTTSTTFTLDELTSSSDFSLIPRSIHTYSDMTVSMLIDLKSFLISLNPAIKHITIKSATSNSSPSQRPASPTLLIVRVHRMTKQIQWALALHGIQAGTASATLDDASRPNLYISARCKSGLSVVRITLGGRLSWEKIIPVDSKRFFRPLTQGIRHARPRTIIIPASSRSKPVFVLLNARTGKTRRIVRISSTVKNNYKRKGTDPEENMLLVSHNVITTAKNKKKDGTFCLLAESYATSSVTPITRLSLACGKTPTLLPLREKQLKLLSVDMPTLPASAFTRLASMTLSRGSAMYKRQKFCSGYGSVIATILYERAFDFDWHSRDRSSSGSPRHELMVVSHCVSTQATRTMAFKLPVSDDGDVRPILTLHGSRSALDGAKVILFFGTFAPLSGTVSKYKHNDWVLDVIKNESDRTREEPWILIIDVHNMGKKPKLLKVPGKAGFVPELKESKYEDQGIYGVTAFDVTTSARKVVVVGLLEGFAKGVKKSGPLFTHTIEIPVE